MFPSAYHGSSFSSACPFKIPPAKFGAQIHKPWLSELKTIMATYPRNSENPRFQQSRHDLSHYQAESRRHR